MRSSYKLLAGAVGVVVFGVCVASFVRSSSETPSMLKLLAAELAARKLPVGEVKVSRSTLSLADGQLQVSLRELPGRETGAKMAHFHFVAVLPAMAETLDACIVGVGDTRAAQEADAAIEYLEVALPPIISHVKGYSLLGATRFHGTEDGSVKGRTGFMGPPYIRGGSGEDVAEVPGVFGSLEKLPKDGRAHLLKAVARGTGAEWSHTVEYDGETKLVEDAPLPDAPHVGGPAAIIRFAVVEAREDPLHDAQAEAAGRKKLEARPSWLMDDAGRCPADLLPSRFELAPYEPEGCIGGRLSDCVSGCERGSGNDCYLTANEVQGGWRDEELSVALFIRACRLGIASGCTNAAAARLQKTSAADDCARTTFTRVCDAASDAWACAMAANDLLSTRRDGANDDRIRALLEKACRHGPSDEACRTAQSLMEKLDAQR